jgi:hypothetical protein
MQSIFSSQNSNKILKHINQFPDSTFIDFSNSSDSNILKMFLKVNRGKFIWTNSSNEEQIQNTKNFPEFDSLSVLDIVHKTQFNFVSQDISSFHFSLL